MSDIIKQPDDFNVLSCIRDNKWEMLLIVLICMLAAFSLFILKFIFALFDGVSMVAGV